VQIQLCWTDPVTNQTQKPFLETPIALGREFTLMPGIVDGQRVSRAVIAHPQIADYHALITEQNGQLLITDQSGSGIGLNNARVTVGHLTDGSRFQIGPVTLLVDFPASAAAPLAPALAPVAAGLDPAVETGCDRKIGFLFQRRCGRTDPTNCPYCQGGQLAHNHDPFRYDHDYYPGYGHYGNGSWGHQYYQQRDSYAYNPYTRSIDFNDSDAASFEEEGDMDYENRLDAS